TGLNAYCVYEYGYVGFFQLVLANAATVAALVDLTIALSLVTLWMWQDARERGIGVVPYVILTLTLGSIGPLCYLIRRESTAPARALRMAAGHVVTRDVGYGIVSAEGFETTDEIIFAQPGDLVLLGVRTIEGFGVLVDNVAHRLVPRVMYAGAAA